LEEFFPKKGELNKGKKCLRRKELIWKGVLKNGKLMRDASDNKSAHYPLHRVAKELKVPVISREHRVPEFTFGAKANLWDYRVDGISTREEDENSKTANMTLEDISEDYFREKDRLVHQEFNRVYRDIFNSKYAKKLLLSENEPPEGFFESYAEAKRNLVQGTNWGPTVSITGSFFATIWLIKNYYLFRGFLKGLLLILGDPYYSLIQGARIAKGFPRNWFTFWRPRKEEDLQIRDLEVIEEQGGGIR